MCPGASTQPGLSWGALGTLHTALASTSNDLTYSPDVTREDLCDVRTSGGCEDLCVMSYAYGLDSVRGLHSETSARQLTTGCQNDLTFTDVVARQTSSRGLHRHSSRGPHCRRRHRRGPHASVASRPGRSRPRKRIYNITVSHNTGHGTGAHWH